MQRIGLIVFPRVSGDELRRDLRLRFREQGDGRAGLRRALLNASEPSRNTRRSGDVAN